MIEVTLGLITIAFQQRTNGNKEEGAKVGTLCPVERIVKGTLPLHRDLRAVSYPSFLWLLPLHLATETWWRASIRVSIIAREILIPWGGPWAVLPAVGWEGSCMVQSQLKPLLMVLDQFVTLNLWLSWLSSCGCALSHSYFCMSGFPSPHLRNKQKKESRSTNISQSPKSFQAPIQSTRKVCVCTHLQATEPGFAHPRESSTCQWEEPDNFMLSISKHPASNDTNITSALKNTF